MIVVDTSALVEIIVDEQCADECQQALEAADQLLMSAGTLLECFIVAAGRRFEPALTRLFDTFRFVVEPVTEQRAIAAGEALRRYGKGRHPASLNYGDLFAYALAKEHDCPLLFVGNDFARTDVKRAIP